VRWWWQVVVSVVALAAPARAQRSEEAVRIQYAAPASCPDAASFVAQLRERTQRGRFAAASELARTFSVTLAADAQGFSGEIEFLDESGAKVNRRVHGEQCDAVLSSLALITALALDATLRSEEGEAVAPITPPDPTPAPQVPPKPAVDAAHGQPTQVSRRGLRAVRAGVQAAYGTPISAPRLGVLGELEFRSGPSLRLTAHYGWHELEVDAGRSANLRLMGLETSLCPWRFAWGALGLTPCAAVDLGALRAAGVPSAQLTQSGDETIWWASISAQFGLSLRLPAPFWVELRGAAEFPLRAGYQFTFESPQQIAYEVPAVSGWGGISTGVRFW
jgi:hypothetical protein